MFQRLKNKKGFTLIELIVVIAILGILALIAIPRFTGFTTRAKIAADEQYGALVGNALAVLLAAGDIDLNATAANNTVTLTGSTEATVTITVDATGIVKSAQTKLTGDLDDIIAGLVVAKPLQHYDSVEVLINADGTYEVTGSVTP